MTQRKAWIELERRAQLAERTVVLADRAEAVPGHHPRPGVRGIEGERILRMRDRFEETLSPARTERALPPLRTPVAVRGPPFRPAHQRVRARIARLRRDRIAEQALGLLVPPPLDLADHADGADDEAPSVDAAGLVTGGAESLLGVEMRLHGGDDALRDVVLDREEVLEHAVVFGAPDVLSRFRLDQLAGDADALAGDPGAAFKHVAHAELASH